MITSFFWSCHPSTFNLNLCAYSCIIQPSLSLTTRDIAQKFKLGSKLVQRGTEKGTSLPRSNMDCQKRGPGSNSWPTHFLESLEVSFGSLLTLIFRSVATRYTHHFDPHGLSHELCSSVFILKNACALPIQST
jgi:hypothetical protein